VSHDLKESHAGPDVAFLDWTKKNSIWKDVKEGLKEEKLFQTDEAPGMQLNMSFS